MNNYKIVVQYDGKNYSGWQKQDDKQTIQAELERAVHEISGESVEVVGSGRTDAGVSALAQVANFVLEKQFDTKKIVLALNAHLPQDIAVVNAEKVDESFNARFSAKKKTYNYYFYVSCARNPILDRFALQLKSADVDKMKEACQYLVGKNDYKCFVARNSGKTNFIRTIYKADITRVNDNLYCFSITGDGFLYNMVRIIMGTLILVGENKRKPADIKDIIESKDRTKAGKTVSAVGLMLKEVNYN